MRLVPTRRLELGAELARDVSTGRPGALPLLRAGAKVSERYRDALLREGIHAVYVEDEVSAGIEIEPVLSDETRREAVRAVEGVFAGTQAALAAGRPLEPETLGELERVARLMAADIAASGEAALALTDLSAADAYTLQHSVDTTALGLLIGQRLFRDVGWTDFRGNRSYGQLEDRLNRLGLGLLLHDIGKLTIPAEILNKPGRLSPEEWELMQGHPQAGVELLRSDFISPLVKSVVRSHHERWDGGGYPQGRAGEDIPQLARIAAVADVYDAVTSERPYKAAAPPSVGVAVIAEGAQRAFDPEIADAFAKVVAPFPPGHDVVLADGSRAVVVSVPREAVDRPLVRVYADPGGSRIAPYELALVAEPELSLAAA